MYFVVLNNVTDKYSILEHSAFLDYHTRVYNRNLWEYLNKDLINLLNCQTYPIILMDIDNLKEMNDSKGHSIGDLAIIIVADAIKESVRKEDIVIRLGGDEFLCILPNIDKEVSIKIVNRIKSGLIEKCKSANLNIEISTGISFGNKMECLENIVEKADFNMYAEKRSKKRIKDKEKQKMITDLIENTKLILTNLEESNGGLISTEVLKTSLKLRQLIDGLNIEEGQ